jgi:hypothetical protein
MSETESAEDVLAPFEAALGYRFRDRELLENALNQPS